MVAPNLSIFSFTANNLFVSTLGAIISFGDVAEQWFGVVVATMLALGGPPLFLGFILLFIHHLFTRTRLVRYRRLVFGAVLALAGLDFGAKAVEALNDRPRSFTLSAEAPALVEGETALALDLYHDLAPGSENLFFSPDSAARALGMAYLGARGDTQIEMASALHLPPSQAVAALAFGELQRREDQLPRGSRIEFSSADSLWIREGRPLLPDYVDTLRRRFRADARTIDFSKPSQASTEINEWVAKSTRGALGALAQPGKIDLDTSLILCDTIHFKGRWRHQYKKSETSQLDFHVATNRLVSVPMMRQKCPCKLASPDDGFPLSVAELPYFGGDLTMVVLMPDEIEGLQALEARLNAQNLKSWLAALDAARPIETSVYFPRFKIATRLNLESALTNRMPVSFGDGSDFSGINRGKDLYLSQVVQHAAVEVDEEGARAGVATHVLLKSRGGTRSFVADHPFIFLIRDNATGGIIFLGKLVDPAAAATGE
jgi:serpin B